MPIPFSFLHDENGDIDMSQGLRRTLDLQTYVVQRLGENLGFFLGEWFLDLRQGVPYFQRVFGEMPDLDLLDTLYRRTILATVGVASITTLLLTYDNARRLLSVSFECVLADGSIITQADLAKLFVIGFS
jgi:hypothetical protein